MSSNQQFIACYPGTAQLVELYERRLEGTNDPNQVPTQNDPHVHGGWIGVRIQEVTAELGEALGLNPPRRALVADVIQQGPAKSAGFEPGDVITSFDGRDIKSSRDLPAIVQNTIPGKQVRVVVIRRGSEEQLIVTVGNNADWFDKYVAAHGG